MAFYFLANTLTVLHTQDNGLYFYFTTADLDRIVGNKNWDKQPLNIKQSGSQRWNGLVKLFRKNLPNVESFGRRDSGSNYGQWSKGDIIELAGKRAWLCMYIYIYIYI